MSTARRQGRPEGAAGIWKSSGSRTGVHGHVDVAVDQVGPIGPPAVEGEGQRVALVRKVGPGTARRRARRSPAAAGPLAREETSAAAGPDGPSARRSSSGRTGGSRRSARGATSRPSSVGLSWHQALLLPCWVRRNSSPPRIIGTPCDDHQGRHQVAHLLPADRAARPGRRSAPRRRSSSSSWRRCRRGSPRRWPRCACGCRRPGR